MKNKRFKKKKKFQKYNLKKQEKNIRKYYKKIK